MAYTNSKKQQTIYIIRESPSEEPIAIFNDIRDAYTFSKERYYGIVRDASSSIQQYYLVEEDLIANTRTIVWTDKTKNTQNSLARYTLR